MQPVKRDAGMATFALQNGNHCMPDMCVRSCVCATILQALTIATSLYAIVGMAGYMQYQVRHTRGRSTHMAAPGQHEHTYFSCLLHASAGHETYLSLLAELLLSTDRASCPCLVCCPVSHTRILTESHIG